jgi:tetratricopeptide (TPR) repeat protein
MHDLGRLHRDQGKYAQAESLFARALETRRRVLGEEHPDTVGVQIDFAEVKIQRQQYSEAEVLLRNALMGIEKTSPESWLRNKCQSILGASLSAQKKYAEAEPLLLSGYDGMLQRQGTMTFPERRNLREANERVAKLYQDWGKPAKAADWKLKPAL